MGQSDEAARFSAAFSWDDLKRIKDTHRLANGAEGSRHRRGRRYRMPHGHRLRPCVQSWRPPARPWPGSMEMLPEGVEAVAGRAKIIVDGGFCRGTDVLKAVALGAHHVGIGRLYLYGLAAGGAAGVQRVLELLDSEVRTSMALLG